MVKIGSTKKKLITDKMRSSEQCFDSLRRGNAFCALGCICDASEVSKWKRYGYGFHEWEYAGAVSLLPREVLKWLGMDNEDPKLEYKEGVYSVSALNDILRLPLPVIADLIEEQW